MMTARLVLDLLMAGVAWPVGLAARLIASSAYPKGRPRHDPALAALPPLPGDGSCTFPLAEPYGSSPPARELVDVVVARRSGPMGGGSLQNVELSTLLTATTVKLPSRLLPDPDLSPNVFPLVFDVEGLPPAAYRYVPEPHEVLRVRSIERDAVRDSLLLQKDHGTAAAILFLVVPMARWLHDFGDRGYRGAALQVGYLIDRLYLTAKSMRLTYTASGGFAPVLADELLDVDGYHRTTMFSFVVGSERKQGGLGSSNGE